MDPLIINIVYNLSILEIHIFTRINMVAEELVHISLR